MQLSIDVAKAPTPPTTPAYTSPRSLAAKDARKGQAKFHRLILTKDGNKCSKCARRLDELTGVYPDLRMLIADHIIPKMLGGTDTVDNGQTLCFFDNLKFGWRSRYSQRRDTNVPAVPPVVPSSQPSEY